MAVTQSLRRRVSVFFCDRDMGRDPFVFRMGWGVTGRADFYGRTATAGVKEWRAVAHADASERVTAQFPGNPGK